MKVSDLRLGVLGVLFLVFLFACGNTETPPP